MTPELSVIVPTYKRTASLQKLLEILLTQQDVDLEIIVVDQNTEDYFNEDMKALLKRVKWIKQENPNASGARNTGFLSAVSNFVLFIDDDLVPEHDFCRKGLDVFLKYSTVGCFVPLVYNDEGELAAEQSARAKFISSLPEDKRIFSITDTMSAAVFFRRAYFFQSGGFDVFLFEFAKTAEDQEFFLRMLSKGMKLWVVPFVKVYHDENNPGGCDLRTTDYWITREKCMRAWALRYRTKTADGKIKTTDFIRLFRSCVLNMEVLRSSPKYIARQFSLMKKTMRGSLEFFETRKMVYSAKIEKGFLEQV